MPDPNNGLRKPSEVEFDWTFTYPMSFVANRIGELDEASMAAVNDAIRLWLDL